MTDRRRPSHDRFERRQKSETYRLQPGRNQVVHLNRDKEVSARNLLGIGLWLDSDGAWRNIVVVEVVMADAVVVVVIAIVAVEIVPAQMRMDPD